MKKLIELNLFKEEERWKERGFAFGNVNKGKGSKKHCLLISPLQVIEGRSLPRILNIVIIFITTISQKK